VILDIFSELQRAKPSGGSWAEDHERQVMLDAIEQAKLADEKGFGCSIESVVIGDVEACRKKMERYAAVGCDRLMCLMQMGGVKHETVMESIRITGEELIPKLAG